MALALEYALAADILKTAIAPTFAVVGQLAAIAALVLELSKKYMNRNTATAPVDR